MQIDVRIDEIVLRALQKTPELRFQTAGEFRTQVETVSWEKGEQVRRGQAVERDPFRASHALPLWCRLILGATFVICLLNFALPHITRLGNGPAPTITIGLSQPWLVVPPQYVDDTRYVRALAWNFRSSSFLSGIVAAIIGATLLLSRIRSEAHREIKTASIALIFALISSTLGALAALRGAGVWPAMALVIFFAGVTIFLALRVRRLGAGKSALIIAALGMVIWPVIAFVVRQTSASGNVNALGIERVEVTEHRAVLSQPRYDLEGMIITFGPAENRWTPSGVYLEAMFDVTLQPHSFGGGADWVVKPRHSIHSRYRLQGPSGSMLGKIVFRRGTLVAEGDGSYVIGEFRPDDAEPLPIAVKLEKAEAAPTDDSPRDRR